MTTETTRSPSDFGEVLERLMQVHGLEPDPDNIRNLAERSGLDPEALLRSMAAERVDEDLDFLNGLADELALSYEEMVVLGVAYTFGGGPVFRRHRHGKEDERANRADA